MYEQILSLMLTNYTDWIIWSLLFVLFVVLSALLYYSRLDRPARLFRKKGLRVPRKRLNALREDMLNMTEETGRRELQAQQTHEATVAHQHRAVVEKKSQAQSGVKLVHNVGFALKEVEKRYEADIKKLKSEQARIALRIASQKAIEDILASSAAYDDRLPSFRMPENQSRKPKWWK